MNKTQEALKMAIEALELINEHAFRCGLAQDAIKACKEALAELSIQWMAENAKELGLDYCIHGSDSACKECYMEQTK